MREQTPAAESWPFEFDGPERPPKRTTRCQILDKTVKFVTRGGQEYIVPVHLPVLAIFPLGEGVLIKAEYNQDLLKFKTD